MKILFIAISLFVSTFANVIGFDLGNTFFKISMLKPGSPMLIVENTTSKRKTETMMTIASD
jgi:molecular chaperone DnaK (HSP70)